VFLRVSLFCFLCACFLLLTLIIDLLTFDLSFCAEEFFLDPSSQRETTVDVGKVKEVAQEPATPVEALETIHDGVDLEAYKRCLEYCQAQGVNLDTFKFVGIGLDKLRIMPRKSELKLSKYIDDVFAVPDTEAQLAGKSSLELADASITMIYKVHKCLFDFVY